MPTFEDLYRPASLKIERAKHHVNDLNNRIGAFLSEKPFELVIIKDIHAGKRTHVIETNKAVPDEIALVIRDAVHNARTALDVTMFSLIGRDAKRPESVQFPFGKRAETLQSTMTNRETYLAGKKVVGLIEAACPYEGGEPLLSGLHSLDIADKHKLVIATGRAAPLSADAIRKIDPGIQLYGPGVLSFSSDVMFDITTRRLPRRDRRANKNYVPSRHKPEIQPAFEITFFGPEFAGQSVVPKLAEIISRVEDLCAAMCRAFIEDPTERRPVQHKN